MQKLFRKELINYQTNFLIKMKHTILNKMGHGNLSKDHSKMLVDILSELDNRQISN